MAKKWTPSEKQLKIYDELLRRQNVTRKRLLRIRKITEKETSFGRGLPDLVIPRKARRHKDLSQYQFNSYKEYRLAMAKLKAEYSDFDISFGKIHYYNNYKVSLRMMLSTILDKDNIRYIQDEAGYIKGTGSFGRFTEEEIAEYTNGDKTLRRYFDFYNKVATMDTKKFLAMYFGNEVPTLKYIYLEMIGTMKEYVGLDEFYHNFDTFYKRLRSGDIMISHVLDFISSRKRITSYEAKKVTSAISRYERNKR